ncbi:hypothetical protein Q5P01_005354 [Channa striata]|uniref:Uncharacterized protein n=1 Tax=Channa striata TaxID=64152 RepID=A0AA88NCQ0_CHASR|nr:hypothetical protein Q5P01_005354 [Channa striata]
MLMCHIVSLVWALAMLISVLAPVNGYVFGQSICGAYAPGDVVIGIALPCHRKVKAVQDRIKPERFDCADFDISTFVRSLATIHEIDKVNAAGFLPGVRLGYTVCDTCSYASKALQNVNHMLAINSSIDVKWNYTDFRPRVKIILGAKYSEESIAMARLLNVYMVPLLSSTSSTSELSDKDRYPVFMRTIPSDKHQTKAVAKIMTHYGWNWIGVVYGDDEYGKAAFQSFLRDADANDICLAYQEVLPIYLDHSESHKIIQQVAQRIRYFSAQVVLLILKAELVELLFKEMITTNTSRTWIATDAWSRSLHLAQMDDINRAEEVKETLVNDAYQNVGDSETDMIKKREKKKKNKVKRRSTEKQRKSSIIQGKVDFPPHMVRAHQAAYTFLNPNITKYETLLGLLEQAAQTQLSLQPMMSALVLRFEEINEALEEMAEDGELMLKEHGHYMALPSGMMVPGIIPVKPSTGTANPSEPPPDLLQQLLQQSTEKMRLVGGSVQALGDTTLEEAVEYFSSLSKLLFEKLQAKQAAEQRLTQILAQVEGAAMRKSNPEDLALHSEDSGIGGENESLTGSERHRHHRGSAGSGSCGSGVNVGGAFDNLLNNLPNRLSNNEDDEEEEEDDDEDNDEYEVDESDRTARKRSNSSPPDPSQSILYMQLNYTQHQESTVKRPMTAITATKPGHSSSSRSENMVKELQKSKRDLDERLKNMAEIHKSKELAGSHRLRRHSSCGAESPQKSSLRANQPCFLPALTNKSPKRQSVRRLINTFSQGVDGRPEQSLANIPPHIRRPRRSDILLLSDPANGNNGSLVINGNNNNNSWPDGKDDLDVENLPPPPPEVLMDNSFQGNEGIQGIEDGLQENSSRSLPMITQKNRVSQRLRASMQNVEVLPNRASMTTRLITITPVHPVRQDAVVGAQNAEQPLEANLDPEMEKANCLYQQARKIIHLRNAAEFPDRRNITELNGRVTSPIQGRTGQRCEDNECYEGEMSPSLPVTAPPVSRVRLPPSYPSVRHRFPSPPVFRPQSPSRPSSRPSSPRMVIRATEINTKEIVPSVSFREARSVFCQNELKNSQTIISSEGSGVPRTWGEPSRGRLPSRRIDKATLRSQSEQRPGLISHSEFSKDDGSTCAKDQGE